MNHGGSRPGAGRKPSGPETVAVNWRVSEFAKSWMKQKAAERGVSIGTILDELINSSTVATIRAKDIIPPAPRIDHPPTMTH